MSKATVEFALEYAQYFPVYPLSKNTTYPIKGSKGHNGATQNQELLVEIFTEIVPDTENLAANLNGTDYFVIDLDVKNGKNGLESLNSVAPKGEHEGLGKPVIVMTKNAGLHLYYKSKRTNEINHQIDWMPGIDIIRNGIVLPNTIAPDENGELKRYKLKDGHSFKNATEPPIWLLDRIVQSQQKEAPEGQFTINYRSKPRTKKWTATFIEELVAGAEEGNRNNFLTKQVGKLLSLGTKVEEAYTFTHIINEKCIDPPLKKNEVDKTFESVLKRELGK